jgi:hypothetical protein
MRITAIHKMDLNVLSLIASMKLLKPQVCALVADAWKDIHWNLLNQVDNNASTIVPNYRGM